MNETILNVYAVECEGNISCVGLTGEFDTYEIAKSYCDSFPKSYGLRPCRRLTLGGKAKGGVYLTIRTLSNKTNQGFNESGINRIKKILARAKWSFVMPYANSITKERFENLIG